MGEALSLVEATVKAKERRCFYFVNADCLNISARDPEYHRVLARPDAIVFGDGAGIRLAGALSRQHVRDNVNAERIGDSCRVANLDRQPAVGPVKDGLAVITDQFEVLTCNVLPRNLI